MSSVTFSAGIVKQVLSGDTIVIRDRPVDGPPPERTIVLSNISCGRVARKPTPNNPSGVPEDPFAWRAREFTRTKLIGKEVCYTVDTEIASGRKYGCVYLGKSIGTGSIARLLVDEGLAEVRKISAALAEKSPAYQELIAAEEVAKTAGVGRWAVEPVDAVRNVIWNIEDPRSFIEKHKGKRIQGVVEYVRDGSTVQLTLLPGANDPHDLYHNIMLSLSGIKAPSIRYEDGQQVAEPYALDAQFFVESRMLQREVVVLLESCNNQNFIGTILHPNGNIAEVLLREGLAKCMEWNLNLLTVPGSSEAYRAAERIAKETHRRIWKDYQAPLLPVATPEVHDPNRIIPGMTFMGIISEVGNGDNVSVKCSDGVVRKFFLSSIRFPKPAMPSKEEEEANNQQRTVKFRPLYDIPYMFEAREQLRTSIGKTATVQVDYIQPKMAANMDERVCCTVTCAGTNLAESLVSQGLANVIRYRNVNDARSSAYLELQNAEEQAISKGMGLHNKSAPPVHRVADLTGNLTKSRQFLPFLKRTPRFSAVVEFVVNASRMRVYLPSETCLVTLLLSGIQCPRRGRPKPDGTEEPDMPFSVESHKFAKDLCMQRNVEVTIETIDRVGNFVGWMFVDPQTSSDNQEAETAKSGGKKKKKPAEASTNKTKVNLSVLLVSQGLATVHHAPATEASPFYHDLIRAEETAKTGRLGLWSSDEFLKQWEAEADSANDTAKANEVADARIGKISGYIDDLSTLSLNGHMDEVGDEKSSKMQWKPAQITGLSKPGTGCEGLRFFAQHSSDSNTIVQLSQSLNGKQAPPPVPGYQPKKGELCAACFSLDNCWYRARVIRRNPKSITVMFVDFGNEETIEVADAPNRLSPLPAGPLMTLPPQAHEYRLAFVQLPPDAADRTFAERAFVEHVENKEVLIADQYGSVPCANETIKPVPGVALKVPASANTVATSSAAGSSNWADVAQLLLEEGLVCVEPMRPELLKPLSRPTLSGYLDTQLKAKKERKNVWRYGDFRVDLGA